MSKIREDNTHKQERTHIERERIRETVKKTHIHTNMNTHHKSTDEQKQFR